MAKTYQVTYKTYFNERVNPVDFHRKQTYPLYVQVTYNRQTIFFKSAFFDLLSIKRPMLTSARMLPPTVEDASRMEEELIECIVLKHTDDFDLELFKREYQYYTRELETLLEASFIDYLTTFFEDKGKATFARLIQTGSSKLIVPYLLHDMKGILTPKIYEELIENSLYHAAPYIPLIHFTQQFKQWPFMFLTVKEWEDPGTQAAFTAYCEQRYPQVPAADFLKDINKRVKATR